MQTVRQWSKLLAVPQYAGVVERNAVNLDLVCELTDEDVERLRDHPLGVRKQLFKAITELNGSLAPPPCQSEKARLPESRSIQRVVILGIPGGKRVPFSGLTR